MMLLRSASAPILHSWLPQHCSAESSQDPDSHALHRTRSISLYSSKSLDEHNNTLTSGSQQQQHHKKTLQPLTFQAERLSSSHGVDGEKVIDDDDDDDDDRVEKLVIGGGGMGSKGGEGGGSAVDGAGGNEDATDVYYREMIELNPGNSLLTGNYAKFLKEVKGDSLKAEEYCERSILGNINDGNTLSLYADLILYNHGDRERAHSYFHQAVKMSPHDCYIQAAYARFLWDVEEGEEEELIEERSDDMAPSNIFTDVSQHYSSITVPP